MQYVYPAVVYKESDQDPFVMVLPDVNIVCEGQSVEEALIEARAQLKIYLECVLKFGANLTRATDFMQFKEKYKDEILLLIECDVNEDEVEEISVLF